MNWLIILTGTIAILLISWFVSIKHKRYHGIARFFAFESVFLLFLLNYKLWFTEPFSLMQLLSWFLLFVSLIVVITGYYQLTHRGKPGSNFEDTTRLVTTGIFRFIRHPLYLSVFLLGTGIMLKNAGPFQLILGTINFFAILGTSLIEEKEMIVRFGEEYREYRKTTKMFIPFVV